MVSPCLPRRVSTRNCPWAVPVVYLASAILPAATALSVSLNGSWAALDGALTLVAAFDPAAASGTC